MKKIIKFITSFFLVFFSSCSGYVGANLNAKCDSISNITQISVRVHNRENACCINFITYEFDSLESDSIDIYFPQKVTIIDSGEIYPVHHWGGQGISDQSVLVINSTQEYSYEEIQNYKVNIYLGNVSIYPVHEPKVRINGLRYLDKENVYFL